MKILRVILDGAKRNAPAILTGLACAGTVAAVVLGIQATPKAQKLIKEKNAKTVPEKIKAAWPVYVPTVGMVAVSCGCAIGSHKISARRVASATALCAILEKSADTYQKKVVETIGEAKESELRSNLMSDKLKQNPPTEKNTTQVYVSDGYSTLFWSKYHNRYLTSTHIKLERAELETRKTIEGGFGCRASLNDFFRAADWPTVEFGEDIGWNADTELELRLVPGATDEDSPRACFDVEFSPEPSYNYYNKYSY